MFRVSGNRGLVCLLATVFALSPLGCGDDGPDYVKTVSGKVVYANGKPVTGGMVVFEPVEEADDTPMAVLGKDGTFSFTEVGVTPGEYRVMLAPSEEGEEGGEAEGSAFQVPEKYLSGESSGWTATIKDGENEPLTFTIK